MDENFEYFLKKMGPSHDRRDVPPSSIDRYRGKLPDQLLAYWEAYGWCGYADGLFWTVDPHDYEPVRDAWLGGTALMDKDTYHVIARSAFGELTFWGETTGSSLKLFAPGAFCMPRTSKLAETNMDLRMQVFFGTQSRSRNDFDGMFEPALHALGPLAHDEMYGFAPALALGGGCRLENIQKVKAVEHLILLAGLAPLQVIAGPA